jgi:hypothetical protein
MEKLECPRCHQRTFSPLRKQWLGPAGWATCSNCHGKVSVPYSSVWTTIPFIIAMLAAFRIDSFALATVVVIVGAAAMCWLNHKYVPLIPK